MFSGCSKLEEVDLSCFSFRPSQAFENQPKSALTALTGVCSRCSRQNRTQRLTGANRAGVARLIQFLLFGGITWRRGFPLLFFVFLIYSPLSDEEGIPHLLWAESWFLGIFQQQIFSHKSPTLLWVWLEGVRMAPISRRGHTMAHRANQGLNQRLFLLSMTTGSSLSTASQILIWGFVISKSSFPCQ